jgi:hypothetical protein
MEHLLNITTHNHCHNSSSHDESTDFNISACSFKFKCEWISEKDNDSHIPCAINNNADKFRDNIVVCNTASIKHRHQSSVVSAAFDNNTHDLIIKYSSMYRCCK